MKYKLFVSDFDGTLGMAPANIEPETVSAVKEYIKRGGKFVICTGRMFAAIKPICDKYDLKGLVISYQGATIDDLTTGKRLLEGGIEYNLAAQITKELLADGMPACVDLEDVMFCEQESGYTDYHKEFTNVVKVDSLIDLVLQKKKPVMKVVTTGEPQKIKELTEKYGNKYKGKVFANNGSTSLLEIVSVDYSKGSSVEFLAKHFNIPYDQIIAVGDSTNDIELIKGEWHGVAVGDARQELIAVAKEVTVEYSKNPVKYLLEKYCL